MDVICHRGLWTEPAEKNTLMAFTRAFDEGFGVETDIRDHRGHLVIAHDLPSDNCLSLEAFLQLCIEKSTSMPLALNIKSDGLQLLLKSQLKANSITNAFFFDMSVPDMIGYLKQELPVYSRQSEYEAHPAFYSEAQGLWIDCFEREWITEKILNEHLDNNKRLCFVSPEIHRRSPLPFWTWLRTHSMQSNQQIELCTDLPREARLFFHD